MFLRYALLNFVYFFNMYDNMFGLLGLSQFSQNVAINAKGGDCWQSVQLIRNLYFMVVIYGNILCFIDNLQLFVKENCLSVKQRCKMQRIDENGKFLLNIITHN